MAAMNYVIDIMHKGRSIIVKVDENNLFHIYVEGIQTQQNLSSVQAIRWLGNVLNDA